MAHLSDMINSSADHVEAALSARASTSVRVLQTAGLALGGYLTGRIGAASFLWIPTLQEASDNQKAKLWNSGYQQSKYRMSVTGIIVAGVYAWLSSRSNHVMLPKLSLPFGQAISFTSAYLISAGLTISVIPYTYLVMKKTNDEIQTIAGQEGATRDVTSKSSRNVQELIQEWGYNNLVRSGLVGVGTVLGIWASINWPSWKHL